MSLAALKLKTLFLCRWGLDNTIRKKLMSLILMVPKWTCLPQTAPDNPSDWTVPDVCAGEAQKLCFSFSSREVVNQILPKGLPDLMPAEVIPSLNSGFKETLMMDKEQIIYVSLL